MSDQNYKPSFFVAPYHITELPGITLAFIKFYETIFQFWNKGLTCFLSNSTIMERTGIKSLSTLSEAFQFFENHGEMKRVTQGGRRFITQPERKVEIDDPGFSSDIPDNGSRSDEGGGLGRLVGGGLGKKIHKINKLNKETNTNSEFENSPAAAPAPRSKSPSTPSPLLLEMIQCYREVFPNNPQPHKRLVSTSLARTLATFIKRWHEADPSGNQLTPEIFRHYLEILKSRAPQFSLGEYKTPDGRTKKNNLETFTRWNTLVKFLEGAYS